VFAEGARPTGGKGEAVFWLPLLALFTRARRSELAALTVENVDSESFAAFAMGADGLHAIRRQPSRYVLVRGATIRVTAPKKSPTMRTRCGRESCLSHL